MRTKVTVGDRTLAEYSYADVTNYLTELDYGNNNSVKYTYDDQGRTLKQIYGVGSGDNFTTELIGTNKQRQMLKVRKEKRV